MTGPSSENPRKDKRIAENLTASPDTLPSAFEDLAFTPSYTDFFGSRMGSTTPTRLPSVAFSAHREASTADVEGVATSSSSRLDNKLRAIFSQTGYTLATLLDSPPSSRTRLQTPEVLATCFRGASGNLDDSDWAMSLLRTKENAPLATTLKVLGLVAPLSEVYTDTAVFLFQQNHPNVGTLCAAAARSTHSLLFLERLVLLARGCSPEIFENVLAGARENEIADQADLDSMEAEYRKMCREADVNVAESIPPHKVYQWHTPELSTLAVLLATSRQEKEFSKKLDELLSRFPSYAAPTLAAIANTRNEELRTWCLAAFEHPALKDLALLVEFLPVSASEPEESFY
jgi:hypothetical protein